MTEDRKVAPDRWLAVVPLSDKTCGLEGCEGEITAVQTMLTPIEGGLYAYEGVWACAEHTRDLTEPQRLFPTCRAVRADGDTPCGAATSHVAIAGVPEDVQASRLRAVPVCKRHAAELLSSIESQ